MDGARRFDTRMTGEEVQRTFGNPEVRLLEEAHQGLEAKLFTVEEKLKNSWDAEWSDELAEQQEAWEGEAVELREQIRASLDALRAAQKKFSTSTGFDRAA